MEKPEQPEPLTLANPRSFVRRATLCRVGLRLRIESIYPNLEGGDHGDQILPANIPSPSSPYSDYYHQNTTNTQSLRTNSPSGSH